MKKVFFIIAALICTLATPAQAQESNVIHLTKEEFKKKVCDYELTDKVWLYKGDKPAIIDFYADWCGPCRKLSPILEEVATEYKGAIYVYKVNTDKEPEIAQAFGIRALPTLLFIPAKGEPEGNVGFLTKEQLYEAIYSILLPAKEDK